MFRRNRSHSTADSTGIDSGVSTRHPFRAGTWRSIGIVVVPFVSATRPLTLFRNELLIPQARRLFSTRDSRPPRICAPNFTPVSGRPSEESSAPFWVTCIHSRPRSPRRTVKSVAFCKIFHFFFVRKASSFPKRVRLSYLFSPSKLRHTVC